MGNGRLMPLSPDLPCKLIDGNSGIVTENKSWILGRIMKDFESWMDPAAVQLLQHMKEERMILEKMRYSHQNDPGSRMPSIGRIGLCVSVYEPDFTLQAGRPTRDLLFYNGIFSIIIQLGISSIPWAIYGDWSVFLLTAAGISLALCTAALPEWRQEKSACRHNSKGTYILTTAGGQHAIVILGNGRGLNLQDLAMGAMFQVTWMTRLTMLTLTIFWVALLITASNEKVGIWYLMAVEAVGTVNNWYVGNAVRSPSAFGIHLRLKEVIGRGKVMDTLYEVEERFPRLGKSMLQTFFPGDLREDEVKRWQNLENSAKARHEAQKRLSLTASVPSPTPALEV
jgi:hypothetical protein